MKTHSFNQAAELIQSSFAQRQAFSAALEACLWAKLPGRAGAVFSGLGAAAGSLFFGAPAAALAALSSLGSDMLPWISERLSTTGPSGGFSLKTSPWGEFPFAKSELRNGTGTGESQHSTI